MKILVVGTNVRNVAESARKAGYDVIALTKYVDEDLRIYAFKTIKIEGDRKWVKDKVEKIAEEERASVVLSTGYEDLDVQTEVLGTQPEEAAKVRDKLRFYRTLEKAGIPYPEILNVHEGSICKPRFGGGGEGTFLKRTFLPDNKISPNDREYIFQRYIKGIPCSVSIIVGRETIPVALNEILAGWKEMNAESFRYSGNITPLKVKEEEKKELMKLAIETAELFDLSGSIGVDFVLADKPYVLEINPRFQGSLDSIEWSCDINLFKLHVLGVEGKKIELPKVKRYAARTILFANKDIEIKNSNLTGNPFFADIPSSSFYRKEEPLVSILASAPSKEKTIEKILKRKKEFLNITVS